jgi:putative ABC transport system substrate-binding protein
MRRREFITLIGGAAGWPLAARAEQATMPVVGYLHSASSEPHALMMAAFREGLKQAGYVEGQNVVLEFRWAEGRSERLPALAAELVRRRVNVLGGFPLRRLLAVQRRGRRGHRSFETKQETIIDRPSPPL